MFEQNQGYGGIHELPPEYVQGCAKLTREAGGLVIADEVQSGFVRLSTKEKPVFWGFEISDIVPDIIVTAKGLGNGFPIAAVMVKRRIAESIISKQFFNTYGGNPMVCAASTAILKIQRSKEFRDNVIATGSLFAGALKALQDKFPDTIIDIRGRGLMYGVEIGSDSKTLKPDPEKAVKIFEQARNEGLILGLGGLYKNVLRVMPPMCVQYPDADFIFDVMNYVLSKTQK